MNPNRQREPEINLDDIASRLRSIFGSSGGPSKNSLPGIIIFGIFTISALIWLGTGFYTVQPGEQAAIRNFGNIELQQIAVVLSVELIQDSIGTTQHRLEH